jgi:hypothetical protein
VGHFVALSVE